MFLKRKNYFKIVLFFLLDTFVFWSALYLALFLRRPDIFSLDYFYLHIKTFIFPYFFFLLSLISIGFYSFPSFLNKLKQLKYISYITFYYFLFGISLFYLFPSSYTPKTVLLIQVILIFVFLSLFRLYIFSLFRIESKINAVLLVVNKEANEILQALEKGDNNIKIIKHLHINIKNKESFNNYLSKIIKQNKVKLLIVDLKSEEIKSEYDFLFSFVKQGGKVMDYRYLYEFLFKKVAISSAGFNWFFENISLSTKIYEFSKRLIDIIVSIPVVLIWILLHPWIAWQIKKDGNPTIFSNQKRVGKYGKEIIVKKYRTMAYTDEGYWPGESENYITTTGEFLRKTRLDELPQILNVLKGELSLIGPRSDLYNLSERLQKEIDYYMIRYSVTPGLSGWAQIMMHNQPRGVEETIERLKYDLYYIKHRSLFLDFLIILRTIRTLLAQEGK